jgi:hypothetical protein
MVSDVTLKQLLREKRRRGSAKALPQVGCST